MRNQSTNTHSRSAAGALAIGGLLVVLYPLSIGPAVWLHLHGWLGPNDGPVVVSLTFFYRPLAWCNEHEVPVVAPVLERYVEWCAKL